MTDRELLELAAKAAEIEWVDGHENAGLRNRDGRVWNPLTDDGDAQRLAVKLKMTVTYVANETWPDVIAITGHQITEQVGSNPYAATRRAIVRAAAELERSKT
jgi:hypothetical protein